MISRNICLALCLFCVPAIYADAINLGAAAAFGVLAGSAVTNTGNSVVTGDVGVSAGTSITGFPPGIVNGTIDSNDPLAMQAQADLTTAYNLAAGEPCPAANVLTGQDLGGLTLTPGVYCFASSAQLTGTLTLNGAGNPNALFVLQMGSTLTTATGASVLLEGGAQSPDVFWQVGSSATLGTNTQFEGNILALTSITLGTGANIDFGRALARNGAVTLNNNNIDIFNTPEPASGLLLSLPLFGLIVCRRQFRIQTP